MDEQKYPASEKLLNLAEIEYQAEDDRKNAIDNKAGLMLAALIAALALLIEGFLQSTGTSRILGIISIVAGIVACILLTCILLPKKYEKMHEESLCNKSVHLMPVDQAAYSLTVAITQKKKINAEINTKKSACFSAACIVAVISMAFLVAFLITFHMEGKMENEKNNESAPTPALIEQQTDKPATVEEAIKILSKSRIETSELHKEKENKETRAEVKS